MAKKKSINKSLGMNEEGNPYGCGFFANIGCLFFAVFVVILVALPPCFVKDTQYAPWCLPEVNSPEKIKKWNAYYCQNIY